jgi:hypothetical protein
VVAVTDGAAGYREPGGQREDRIYLGWQYELLRPDPGPPPRRPVPPGTEPLSQNWLDAQYREDRRLDRPLWRGLAGSGAGLAAAVGLGLGGLLNPGLAAVAGLAALGLAARCGRALRDGRTGLRDRIEAERLRVAAVQRARQRRLAARQEAHAQRFRDWQARRASFDAQPQWYAVSLPAGIDRIDVAGGTLAGWSALLTMIAAPRLDAGGQVTVLDLTEGGVAGDLIAAAARTGLDPLVWVLPGDLPRLELGPGLGSGAFAEVLAAAAAAGDQPGGAAADLSGDTAILERVLGVLPGEPRVAAVTAALRALAGIGDSLADLHGGLLTGQQLTQLRRLYGQGAADRVVTERAWAIEARLRKLDGLAAGPVPLPPSPLRVAWLDRRASALGNQVIASYLAAALAQLLRRAPAGRRWDHTLCVLGADRLPPALVDGLCAAGELSGTGLVLAYRTLPAHVRERLGRGHAAVAFMRLGNAEEAKAASEQIGTEHRFTVSQLTDTIGLSVTDTTGDSYTSTVGTSDSVAGSVSVSGTEGRSRSSSRGRDGTLGPLAPGTRSSGRDASFSRAVSGSCSVTAGISDSTAWGLSTSRAAGLSESAGQTVQRSREFLVEAHELQQLPTSAVLLSYAGPGGRQVVLADANPGLAALPTATLVSLAEARLGGDQQTRAQPTWARQAGYGQAGAGRPDHAAGPPANLGPPPRRLDWRTYRR